MFLEFFLLFRLFLPWFFSNLFFLYDADSAGLNAMLRGLDVILEQDCDARIVQLPPEEDPDSYVKKHNADIGICLDGDADRCMFVDEKGEIVRCDIMTALVAKNFLEILD